MSSAQARWAIDANVILRFLLRDVEELALKAAAIIHAVQQGQATVVCDPVTLAEVVYVLSSQYDVPNERISDGLIELLHYDSLVMLHKSRYVVALRLFAEGVPHFGDACACAAALEECDGRLYSFDRKLSAVPGIRRQEQMVPEDG